jgi:hypothetical protein
MVPVNDQPDLIKVGGGDNIDLGGKTLQVISAPFCIGLIACLHT